MVALKLRPHFTSSLNHALKVEIFSEPYKCELLCNYVCSIVNVCFRSVVHMNTSSSFALILIPRGTCSGSISEWKACKQVHNTSFTLSIYANLIVSTIMVCSLIQRLHTLKVLCMPTGMQPLMYSEREAEQGWRRVGYNIRYYSCSGYHYPNLLASDGEFFTLSWTMVKW